jgi:endonuclease-3
VTEGLLAALPTRRRRARTVVARLYEAYPAETTALDWSTPWQLLVAVVLSAQTTDTRVNQVTPALFARFPTPAALAEAPLEEIEALIRPTGFFRAKARSIRGAAGHLLEHHGGEVPRTTAELVRVPGVGRKTAAVVLGHAYGVSEGVAVDTHAGRVSRRLGLIEATDPVAAERELMAVLARRVWIDWTNLAIAHGRAICRSRVPRCGDCLLADL